MVPNSRSGERAASGCRVFYEIVSGDSRLFFASPSRGGGSGMGFAGVGGVYSGATAYSQRKRWTSSLFCPLNGCRQSSIAMQYMLRPPNGWTKQGCCSPVAIAEEKVSCSLLKGRFLVVRKENNFLNNRLFKNQQRTTEFSFNNELSYTR